MQIEVDGLVKVIVGNKLVSLLELHRFEPVKRYGIRRADEKQKIVIMWMTISGAENMLYDLHDRVNRTNWASNLNTYRRAITRLESSISQWNRKHNKLDP